MPYSVDDLLTPRGRLNGAALWPHLGEPEREDHVQVFLDEGYAKPEVAALDVADRDEPARLWAYHRAYQSAYERLLLTPSSVETSDQGSASYLLTQMEHVGGLAASALAEFEVAVGALAVESVGWPVITSLR